MNCGCNQDGKKASCHSCAYGKHCQEEKCVNDEKTTQEPNKYHDDDDDKSFYLDDEETGAEAEGATPDQGKKKGKSKTTK